MRKKWKKHQEKQHRRDPSSRRDKYAMDAMCNREDKNSKITIEENGETKTALTDVIIAFSKLF